MSHVDEGALHAYLDGALDELGTNEAEAIRAHLDGCAECAARLEAERSVRSDAHAILGLAAPEVELPSLEELRAYVKRTRPERPSASGRLSRLGWAASVMIAVGAGWMIRDGQLQQGALQRGGLEPSALQQDALEQDAPQERALSESLQTEGSAPPPAEEPVVGRQVAADAEREAIEAEGPRTGARLVSSDARSRSDEQASPVANVLADVAELPADALSKAAPAAVASPTPVDPSRFQAVDAASRPIPAPAVSVTAMAGAGAARADADSTDEAAGRAERRRAESLVPVTSAMDLAGAAAPRTAEDDASARPAEPALAVPGYEVVSVTNLGDGTASVGAYVVQRLGGDTLLEIFHLEPGVDPSVLPAQADGVNEVRLDAEGGWVVLRGPVETAELEALLARLFPEPAR